MSQPFAFKSEVPKPMLGPACPKCGTPTHLLGIEPHSKFTNLDNRIFECVCGERVTAAVQRN